MNWLLLNEETENGLSAAAEDIDAEEDDGNISTRRGKSSLLKLTNALRSMKKCIYSIG
jgi:hypothetical protein